MSKLLEKVKAKVIEDFKGITRWDKNIPYHTHLTSVSDIAESIMDKYLVNFANWDEDEKRRARIVVKIIGLAHDETEDLEVYKGQLDKLIRDLKALDEDKELTGGDWLKISLALYSLDKNNYENYRDFTLAARSYVWARIVKIADITHNLSDLKKKGSMKDKYLLALHILEN